MGKRVDSPRYRAFIRDRDIALENLLAKTQTELSDTFRLMLAVTRDSILASYPLTKGGLTPQSARQIEMLGMKLRNQYSAFVPELTRIWKKFRRQSYIISNAGEQGALLRAGVITKPEPITWDELEDATDRETELGTVQGRVIYLLSKLERAVLSAVELSVVYEEDVNACMERVRMALPRPEAFTHQRELPRQKVKEADGKQKPPAPDMGFSYVTDAEWDDIVATYKKDFIPRWRDVDLGELETPVTVGKKAPFLRYPWELEREITEDFVDSVRKGEVAAAKKNGITDFMWVAVLDAKTDECCIWRDGLTTKEIQRKLNGEHADDECRAVTPPAHFNCRCRVVPVAAGLEDLSKFSDEEFDSWLES